MEGIWISRMRIERGHERIKSQWNKSWITRTGLLTLANVASSLWEIFHRNKNLHIKILVNSSHSWISECSIFHNNRKFNSVCIHLVLCGTLNGHTTYWYIALNYTNEGAELAQFKGLFGTKCKRMKPQWRFIPPSAVIKGAHVKDWFDLSKLYWDHLFDLRDRFPK